MEYNRTTPSADGYYMPAEYEPHKGCIMIWPQRPGSWKKDAKDAEQAFWPSASCGRDRGYVRGTEEGKPHSNQRTII